ncbi:hypothetical protein HOK51_05685 [Candidatus Woesearchaeota archaeon]|jgi:hypothetical protein|nr:hypothetical protein [Candidatus Woesearchaeota archaeon]MBT6519320.1 hypothetical protein [Candidatus Woesearchaeota archaeon]MBT7368973.1 hypothetical protein [Candidatus Woesearchaeota archaeon]
MTNTDSDNLDTIVITTKRKPGIVKLLEALKKQDEIFNYNVPPVARTTFDDDTLLKHLEQIYSEDNFVVEDPILLWQYARTGLMVEATTDIEDSQELVNTNDQGKISHVYSKETVVIKINKKNVHVSKKDIVVLCEPGFFTKPHNIPKKSDDVELKKGQEVQYKGKPIKDIKSLICRGSKGVISDKVRINREDWFFVTWLDNPENKFKTTRKIGEYGYVGTRPSIFAKAAYVKLFVPNRINYHELYQQCVRGK